MVGELKIIVHIDRDLDLWTTAHLPGGSTVAELKAALLCRDAAGKVLREGHFQLRLPGGQEVGDDVRLGEALGELEVCDTEEAEEAAGAAVACEAPELEREALDQSPGAAEEAEVEAPAGKAGVTLRTVAGREEVLHGLRPEDLLLQLAERAAEALEFPLRELGLCLGSQPLRPRDLHEPLAKLGIGDGSELTVIRRAPAAEGVEIVDYRVLQGPLFKKPGEDPTSEHIITLSRPVASRVKTTGRTWTGPLGGQWVELDHLAERPGWLLVQGPGFDRHGPLLERVVEGEEEEPIALTVISPVFNDGARLRAREHKLCDICVRPSQTLGEVKSIIEIQCPEFRARKIQLLTLEQMAHLSGDLRRDFVENDLPLKVLNKEHGDTLPLLIFK